MDQAQARKLLKQMLGSEADFRDGQETLRWSTSQTETWEERASMMRNALNKQVARDREAA